MSRPKLNVTFQLYRRLLSNSLLLVLGYLLAFTWIVIPPLAAHIGWQPDTVLTVIKTTDHASVQGLRPGDIILAIDNRPAERGRLLFAAQASATYVVDGLRDGQPFRTQAITSAYNHILLLSRLLLTAIAVGFAAGGWFIVNFGRTTDVQASQIGYSFMLVGLGIASGGPTQLGAPGAWLFGHFCIFFFPLILTYLALVPRVNAIPRFGRIFLQFIAVCCVLLALTGAAESLLLFPSKSLFTLIGISSIDLLTGVMIIAVVGSAINMIARFFSLPKKTYEQRQLKFILLCWMLGTLPLVVLFAIPTSRNAIITYLIVFGFLLLIPAGYFYVLFRDGLLELDAIFGRIITLCILAIVIVSLYFSAIFVLELVATSPISDTAKGGFGFILIVVTTANQKHIEHFVDQIVYGVTAITPDQQLTWNTMLLENPDTTVLKTILHELSTALNCEKVAIVRTGEAGNEIVAAVPMSLEIEQLSDNVLAHEFLRTTSNGKLPEWISLLLPLQFQGQLLGSILLSKPRHEPFHLQHVAQLRKVATMLAANLQVVSLVTKNHHLTAIPSPHI